MTDIRAITDEDVPRIAEKWNGRLIHEPIDAARFRSTIMGDANYEPAGHLVAVEDGAVVGFVSAICRDGVPGRDGKGSREDANRGYVRDIFGSSEEVLGSLLDAALAFLKKGGKSHILTGEYTGSYVTPGVDSRYEALVSFLRTRFPEESTLDDMEADLKAPLPNAYQQSAIRRAERYGVRIEPYDSTTLSAMRGFVDALGMGSWFPPGWEQGYEYDRDAFVALRDGEIVGWTDYDPTGDAISLGPIGVAPEHRGHGIGSWLVVECMREGVRRGYGRIWAGWTNTPFYIPQGWRVFRRYIVFETRL